MLIDRREIGTLRVGLSPGRSLSAAERSLLRDVAERASLSIRRALLHEEEHRTAIELQRGLLPKGLPVVDQIELAAHYEAAGLGAEVGGDWYDAFALPEGCLGVVIGDVAGRSIWPHRRWDSCARSPERLRSQKVARWRRARFFGA